VPGRPLDDVEYERVRIALSGVGRLSGRFGVERIAQMLVGSRERVVLSRGLDRIPTYGRLSSMRLEEVKALLGVLADAGLLERQGLEGGRPGVSVLALTAEGRAVAKGLVRPELALPAPAGAAPRRSARAAAANPPAPAVAGRGAAHPGSDAAVAESGPAPAVDADLLERLKAWRTAEARRRGVPAYVVFADRVLAAIAAARPEGREALLGVKGVGPAKLESYAEAILALVTGGRPAHRS